MPPVTTTSSALDRTRRNEKLGTFAERFPILFEPTGRLQKAAKIIAVLRDAYGDGLATATLLEVGASTGIMTAAFAEVCNRVVAFDLDRVALHAGAELTGGIPAAAQRVRLLVGDGCSMPVAGDAVDVVVCNHVYEHVEDARALMDEIHRVLRPGGVCYFGIGTRHVLVEGHYKLPFLSWLPPHLADVYIRLGGRNLAYDVKLLSYRNLRKLVRRFIICDYTLKIIRRPDEYAALDVLGGRRWLARVPIRVLKAVRPFLPVQVWILRKAPILKTESTHNT